MRWKTIRPEPKLGDIRTIRRFAWFPFRIGDETVWLESYEVTQKREIQIEGWDQFPAWVDIGTAALCWYY